MKRIFYLLVFVASAQSLFAQLPEDALRLSWTTPSGTARHQAIGGAMVSLGGEITSTFANPAGLGMYKTGEFVLSPGFGFLNGKGSFRGTDAKADNLSRFHFGTSGFVIGSSNKYSRWTSRAFSIAVNKTANFNSTVYYKGLNDYSSFAEPLANEFASSGLTIDQALNSPNISLLTKMALYTYLVDTASVNGSTQVIARSELAGVVNQENKVITRGGVTEIAFGFGANMDDKLYLGFGFGLPIVNYEKETTWREEDANGTGNNEFAYSTYKETYTSQGVGVNARFGLIFKPVQQFRVGFAIQTPSLYGLKDRLRSELTTDIDTATGSVKVFTVNATELTGGDDPRPEYDLNTPWRLALSGSYVIHEVEDVTKQRGFITADVEYVGYGKAKFKAAEENGSNNQYNDLNTAVDNIYKGAFNFKVGGELKFNTIMGRLGFAYYGNPYEDSNLKGSRMFLSGGAGYRNKGMFIDLTYVHSLQKDVNFPYRVDAPRLNTFANVRENMGNILLTLGFKF
jgi:hypothetical protein